MWVLKMFPRERKILSGPFGSRVCGSEAFASIGQWIMVSGGWKK